VTWNCLAPLAPPASLSPPATEQKSTSPSKAIAPATTSNSPVNAPVTKTKSQNWREYFRKQKPQDKDVQEMALTFNQANQHAELIRYLQAALIEGYSQPWVYGVLAISMKIEKFPQAEIERVLQSLSDIQANDVEEMMLTAATLVRFDADAQAFNMYQEASKRAMNRPEPYILGLKCAQKIKNDQGIVWAACGILSYDWLNGFEQRHKDAENALLDLETALSKSDNQAQLKTLRDARQQAIEQDLSIRVDWSGAGELDLIVKEPDGSMCQFDQTLTSGGGIFLHDGSGPSQKNCYEEYLCPQGYSGTYQLTIKHVWGDIVGKRCTLTLIQHHHGQAEVINRSVIVLEGPEVQQNIELKEGRRSQATQAGSRKVSMFDPQHPHPPKNPNEVRQRILQANGNANLPASGVSFAVGYTPIISVIPEGASLNAAAVVSPDRRYVRINAVPQFSTITDVFTFGFVSGGGTATGN
jgi:hypothetical protein